jgi:hypothetical protein
MPPIGPALFDDYGNPVRKYHTTLPPTLSACQQQQPVERHAVVTP